MKAGFWAAAVAVLLSSAPARAAEWWWIGVNGEAPNRVVTYVDRGTIIRKKDDRIEVWAYAVGETALPNGQQYQSTLYALRCRAGTYAAIRRVAYDRQEVVMPLPELRPGPLVPAPPGSIAESILRLACGRPAGNEVRVAEPFEHASAYLAGRQAGGGDAGQSSGVSMGTGFFIGPDGHVLTSHHVVAGADRLGCRTPDGKVLKARIARISPANDLALLQVDARPPRYLGFAPPGTLRPGDRVFTVGYGAPSYLGINEPRFTDGTVSALSGLDAEDAFMQISVPVQPGNSGGPLLNESGQVVGIVAAQAAVDSFLEQVGTLPQSINWAVKSEYATPLMSPLAPAARRTRDQAIDLARNSICLVIAVKEGD